MIIPAVKIRFFLTIAIFSLIIAKIFFYLSWGSPSNILNLIFLKCPFFLLTGWTCPTCGLGHSFISLIEGNILKSWNFHPAGILISVSILVITTFLWVDIQSTIDKIKNTYSWVASQKKLYFPIILIYTFWGFSRNII